MKLTPWDIALFKKMYKKKGRQAVIALLKKRMDSAKEIHTALQIITRD